MAVRFLGPAVLFVVTCALPCAAQQCGGSVPKSSKIESGQDADGFFIRVRPIVWAGRPAAARRAIQPLGDYLASRADIALFYLSSSTSTELFAGEWRGPDPLSCLKSFVDAAGLKIVVPQPDFWIIGEPEKVDQAAIVVFAYPLDPEAQGWQSEEQVGDVERALFAQLPIRSAPFDPYDMPTWIGIGYHWVEGERDTFLVIASHGCGYCHGTFTNLTLTAFKVRIHRSEAGVDVECLWGAGVSGPLVPTIAEDLDGDGLQEFVFYVSPVFSDRPAVILSGEDGREFASFTGPLYVQKGTPPPTRFSVSSWIGGQAVYAYNEKERSFRQEFPPAAARLSEPPGAQGSSQETPCAREEYFIRELGGGASIRMYDMPELSYPPPRGGERVPARLTPVWNEWVLRPGYARYQARATKLPLRVLYSYFSPGYLASLRLQDKETGAP